MNENSPSDLTLMEVHKKVIPGVGDFIMYQGSLLEVVKIKHVSLHLIVKSRKAKINLPLKVGYRIFAPVKSNIPINQ